MRIACPVCDAQYQLPPALAAKLPTRTRCARCGAEWEAVPPVPPVPVEAEAFGGPEHGKMLPRSESDLPAVFAPGAMPEATPEEAIPKPVPVLVARTAVPAPELRRPVPAYASDPRVIRKLWAGSFGLVIVLIALVLVFHGAISAAWPPSLRVYRALGLG
ncbi:MAG: zinc-ribbon domain-containing protein [Acidiphilium sp.]|nr:zinc-ribbon domain-containing protein [Acidiphilium sp.]MDD4936585.1 zinc-ribbon domain-containing protein [Acidiphilium sp.]